MNWKNFDKPLSEKVREQEKMDYHGKKKHKIQHKNVIKSENYSSDLMALYLKPDQFLSPITTLISTITDFRNDN